MQSASPLWKYGSIGLVGILTLLFGLTAIGKLVGAEPIRESLEHSGLGDMILIIGLGELASAMLYAFRKTSSLGTVLLSAHMGGAICLHMSHGEPYVAQSVILVLVWVGQFLRSPDFFLQTWRGTPSAS